MPTELSEKSNVSHPQKNFSRKVDNSKDTFFAPFLQQKPNALFPLLTYDGKNKEYEHPYEKEINDLLNKEIKISIVNLEEKYNKEILSDLQNTPYHWIETKSGLEKLLAKLEKVDEFSIDSENHDKLSYQGFICLLQISTKDEDFIIDALKLRDELTILNEVTTNPKILKVLHGADQDIVWLQRDFSVYLVNVIDTGMACSRLDQKSSLGYLLDKHFKVKKDKKITRTDWRIRPLNDTKIDYARNDTHYLLYIKDSLTNDLIEKSNEKENLLKEAILKSNEMCLTKYYKQLIDEKSILKYIIRFKLHYYEAVYKYIFYRLYLWRDKKARSLDRNWSFIITNKELFNIVINIPMSIEMFDKVVEPNGNINKYKKAILSEVKKAVETFADNPNLHTFGNATNKARKPESNGDQIN